MKMTIGLRATHPCPDVKVEIFVNQQLTAVVTADTEEFVTEIVLPENPAQHQVELCMSGKTHSHTVIDEQGNIVSDVAFVLQTLEIQDIDMKPIFCQGRRCYFHSHNNPQGDLVQDEMYDYIGYNGRVQIEFFTPIYLWMSEYF